MTAKRQAVGLLLIMVLAVAAACGETLRKSIDVQLKPRPGITDQNVASQIKLAGEKLGWRMKDLAPGQIEGELNVRDKHYVKVLFEYDADSYTAHYRESRGLNYNGVRIHYKYHDWLNNIEQSVRRELEDQ